MAGNGLYTVRLDRSQFSPQDIESLRRDAEELGFRTELLYAMTNIPLLLLIGELRTSTEPPRPLRPTPPPFSLYLSRTVWWPCRMFYVNN